MRAISLRTACSRPWLSSCPVACWNRRLNSSILASASLTSSSSSVALRKSAAVRPLAISPHLRGFRGLSPGLAERGSRSLAFASRASGACASASALTHLSCDKAALHWQFVHRAAKCLPGHRLGHARQLEHDPARFDVGDPPLRRALAGSHPGLRGLLGQRAVRVDVDPHLPATADVPGHRDTCGLDLPVVDVGVLECLDAVLTERHTGATGGGTVPVWPVLLAVRDPARNEHA